MLTSRTQEEIVERINQLKENGNDPLGFERSDLINYLPFRLAKEWLSDDVTEEEWNSREGKTPKHQMKDYMEFAWEKANDERGLSAYRSMAHYTSWLWLDGDDYLCTTLRDYTDYGRPQLVDICKHLEIDWEPFLLSKYS